MTEDEWESLCDGCGLCCQVGFVDIDTDGFVLTTTACRYLCLKTHTCKDYANRFKNVEGCGKITPQNIHELDWLPTTCGYRLAWQGLPLPEWHHLICGDKSRVHTEGPSMMGELTPEDDE